MRTRRRWCNNTGVGGDIRVAGSTDPQTRRIVMMARDVARRVGRQMVAINRFRRVVLAEDLGSHAIWIEARTLGGDDLTIRGMGEWIALQEQMGWPH
jgi:hypothetical protein